MTVITACLTVSATLYTVQRNDDQQAKVLKESQDELVQTQKAQQENADLERITDMNTQFTVAADHLASASAATRAMGVSELAMLADNWGEFHRLDDGGWKKAAAIDALVNYLKTPFELTADTISDNLAGPYGQEMSVRSLISQILHDRLNTNQGGPCMGRSSVPPAAVVKSEHYSSPSTGNYSAGSISMPSPVPPPESADSYTLPTDFEKCWSDHNFDFTGANFYMMDFSDAYFAHRVSFEHAHFYGVTYFIRTAFLDEAVFWEAQFHSAGWRGTDVAGYTSFSGAVFSGGADFNGAVFDRGSGTGQDDLDVDFIGADFNGDSRFVDSEFKGAVSFDYAEFSRDYLGSDSGPVADFTGMAIGTQCDQDCVSGPDAELTNVTFYGGAIIHSTYGGQHLVFSGSHFYGTSTLDQSNWCLPMPYFGYNEECLSVNQYVTMESGAKITYTSDMDGTTCSLDADHIQPVRLDPC